MNKSLSWFAASLSGCALLLNSTQAAEVSPLRVLLISGGCCHDYSQQKDILKRGLEQRANLVVTQIYTDDPSTKPPLAILGNPDYAKGYDVIIHDECAADINDPALIKGILAPHRAGIPGVNLHCAVHCYRIGNPGEAATPGSERAMWFDYLGLQSSGHGPQMPIAIRLTETNHAILQGLSGWTTVNEELYNNIQIRPSVKALARGTQTVKNQEGVVQETESVVTWINDYQGTRVFSTTIGHNNATVADARYLDLVTRGLLWACGKLDDQGGILAGYGPKK
jgi:hypothetical protein